MKPSPNFARRTLVTVTTVLAILSTVAPAAAQTTGGAGSAGTLVVGFNSVPRHLNSAVQSGTVTGIPAAQIFASPLRFDKDWNPEPYLAETWSFQDDGKSVLLKIRAGATFHDGKPITSEDVAFSIMTIKANHPFQSMFEPVERVDTPTPRIAVIRMRQPHPAILLALSPPFCPIIPKHVFGDGTDVKAHPKNNLPVGSGPFKVVSFNPRESIVMERHAGYFFPDRPKFDKLIFRIYSDPSSLALGLERGEVDFVPQLASLAQLKQLSRSKDIVVSNKGGPGHRPAGLAGLQPHPQALGRCARAPGHRLCGRPGFHRQQTAPGHHQACHRPHRTRLALSHRQGGALQDRPEKGCILAGCCRVQT